MEGETKGKVQYSTDGPWDSRFYYDFHPAAEYFNLEKTNLRRIWSNKTRYSPNLPSGGRLYRGKWKEQLGPTCAALATVNALRSLRVESTKTLQTDLVESATPGWGMFIHEIDDIANNHTKLPVDYEEKYIDPNAFYENAKMIKNGIDNGSSFIFEVNGPRYTMSNWGEIHAIAIVGYYVHSTKPHLMEVQVIDSNVGIFWIPYEHLANSLVQRYSQNGTYSEVMKITRQK